MVGVRSALDLGGRWFFRLQSLAGVGVSTFTVRATARPLGAMIRDLPNYPLTRLGCLALRFHGAPAACPFAGEVDASRDGARDSATRPAAPLGRGERRQIAWA
jgi:hypothetical protein